MATSAAGALLASLLTVSLTGSPTASAAPVATAGPSYHATITRTAHGIPHITATDFGSLGFGSGYAANRVGRTAFTRRSVVWALSTVTTSSSKALSKSSSQRASG